MAERRTTVDGLADAIMDGLKEYADLATDTVKDAVKDVSKTVKKDIQANAPKRTGRDREKDSGKQQFHHDDCPFQGQIPDCPPVGARPCKAGRRQGSRKGAYCSGRGKRKQGAYAED